MMQSFRQAGAARHGAIAGAGLLVLLAGLGLARLNSEHRTARHVSQAVAPTTQRTAGKAVCPSLTLSALPPGITYRDRTLVPFSPSVLGVDAIWANSASTRSIEMLDGGYVDDITEPYDGLHPAAAVMVQGKSVTVLTTVFLKRQVFLGYWRQQEVAAPCNVHAIVTLGLSGGEFNAVVRSLR
jgi:hypothetical protein